MFETMKAKANVALGVVVRETTKRTAQVKAFAATPEGKLAKMACAGAYLGYVLGAVVQHVTEEL
jgi:hypothetical protein